MNRIRRSAPVANVYLPGDEEIFLAHVIGEAQRRDARLNCSELRVKLCGEQHVKYGTRDPWCPCEIECPGRNWWRV